MEAQLFLSNAAPCRLCLPDRGAEDTSTFRKCMALTLTTVPILNKGYNARFVRTMCTGDRQCEIKIEEIKQPDGGGKK